VAKVGTANMSAMAMTSIIMRAANDLRLSNSSGSGHGQTATRILAADFAICSQAAATRLVATGSA